MASPRARVAEPRRASPDVSAQHKSPIKTPERRIKVIREERAALEAELSILKSKFQLMSDEEFDRLLQRRDQLREILSNLEKECEAAESEIKQTRDRIIKMRSVPQMKELETELENLLREERVWDSKRQIKVDEKKEMLKNETKKQLAALVAKKKMVEGDLQVFQAAVARLKALRAEIPKSPRKDRTQAHSPVDVKDLEEQERRLTHEVRRLESKCRILKKFVMVMSPDRYKRIVFPVDDELGSDDDGSVHVLQM
jgi:hypothetical protein